MTDYASVIILGLGGMGSAAALALSRRGVSVIGLEQHEPAHARGSSHGDSRVIRQAYLEHPSYVPLVLEAYEYWRRLERESGQDLLHETGGLMIGPESCQTITGSVLSARTWDLDHELLDSGAISQRWPVMTPCSDDVAIYEPHAGWVPPERTVAAQLRLAAGGAESLRFHTRALQWTADKHHVTVKTSDGTVTGGHLLICAGAWSPVMLPELTHQLIVERHVQVWLTARGGLGPFRDLPIWIWEDAEAQLAYGFPAMPGDDGVKVALMRDGRIVSPDELQPEADDSDVKPVATYLTSRIPALQLPARRAVPCMYTRSPDDHFIIGSHPNHDLVTIAAGFSGHGFKFVPLVGEILADLATEGATSRDIALFAPARLRV